MEKVKSLNPEVRNNISGTTQKRYIAAILPGKCGVGNIIITKVMDNYFEVHSYNKANKWTLYRCKTANNNATCNTY